MLLCDLHTHTIVSGHAYSTLNENIAHAKKVGLKILGTSEHAETMPGTCNNIYFYNFRILKRDYDGLLLLRGAEANILNYNGDTDCDSESLKTYVDYLIASLHSPCISSGTVEENTNALIGSMKNEKVKIIGHPDDGRFPLDYEKLVKAIKEKGILVELNNSSLSEVNFRQNAKENILKLLEECKKHNQPVVVNTDAHVDYLVGDFTLAKQIIEIANFPKELIINYDETPDRLFKYLDINL